jgi:hypothetical protein
MIIMPGQQCRPSQQRAARGQAALTPKGSNWQPAFWPLTYIRLPGRLALSMVTVVHLSCAPLSMSMVGG